MEKQGLGIKNLYVHQGVSHVINIIDHIWHGTMTGKLMENCLQQLRLELGINGPIFSKNQFLHDHYLLTDSWVANSWEFTSKHGIKFDELCPDINYVRANDGCIMEEVYKCTLVSDLEARKFNICRMYLQVFLVSDITSGDRKYIRKIAWEGSKDENRMSSILWPKWGRPRPSYWANWRKVLKKYFCTKEYIGG